MFICVINMLLINAYWFPFSLFISRVNLEEILTKIVKYYFLQ